jgi:hypothetical protein
MVELPETIRTPPVVAVEGSEIKLSVTRFSGRVVTGIVPAVPVAPVAVVAALTLGLSMPKKWL